MTVPTGVRRALTAIKRPRLPHRQSNGMQRSPRTDTRLPSARVNLPGLQQPGELAVPADAVALVLVLMNHPLEPDPPGHVALRGGVVAAVLQTHRLATLQLDVSPIDGLGRPRNPGDPDDPDDVPMPIDCHRLAQQVGRALLWVASRADLVGLPVALFGTELGAAAALVAAADQPAMVSAVVGVAGRPELAIDALASVQAPTLLIVGAHDAAALKLNRAALRLLRCSKRLEALPGATHGFGEPEALESATELAAAWIANHLTRRWTS